MDISFFDFEMNKSIIAPIIYGNNCHSTTNKGVVISSEIRQELKEFFVSFNALVGVERTPYYRIDAYFDGQSLCLLEINAAFVDGWGTALNLARASEIEIDSTQLVFPKRFASKNRVYLPELELFISELGHLGFHGYDICDWNGNDINPVYVYGRVGSKDRPHVLPYDGLRLDNKLNLGILSRDWNSDLVKIPRHYISRFESWEEIPREVVLKFCDKGSAECKRANRSVIFNKPSGKAPFLRRCYREEKLVGQEFVPPTKQDGNNCQLIIFVIGDDLITGYVQYSRDKIINDNSIHAPLQIK